MSFADLGLSDRLLAAVTDSGYDVPTPIQKAAIPAVLMGKDLIGIAQTGTGKTAAFVLPMIDILAEGRSRARMPRSLILEPTRELAAQVAENFEKYGVNHKLSMALLIGGVQMGDQIKALEKGVDVLIATPGRLMDLFERGKILLTGCDLLVIDEADRMLDMGFIPDIETICSRLPKSRQTLLFSATMPPPIQKLASKFLNDPKRVEVARAATANENIDQRVVITKADKKRDVLRSILRSGDLKNAIVFCNRKTTVRELAQSLKRSGFRVGQIHGDMEQPQRIAELDLFKADQINVLVASDVAARGLDIKGVSHVVNFDVPWQSDDYVHRIGRTGRAGAKGIAYTIATSADAEAIDSIEKLTGKKLPRFEERAAQPAAAQPAASATSAPAKEETLTDKVEEAPAPKTRSRGGRGKAKAETPKVEVPRAEPKRERAAESRAEPKRERAAESRAEPERERTPEPRAKAEKVDDVSGDWNGPVPTFLNFSAL